jgi:hypothetical protein
MKFTVSFLCASAMLVSTATLSRAESPRLLPEDYLNLLRIDMRASKAEIVGGALELSPREAEVFWPIYREYDAELSRLNAQRIGTLRQFAEQYASIDDEKAAELSRRTFDFMHRRLDLLQKYSRKLAKAISPTVAARFAQTENQLQMLLDVKIDSEFPLVPRPADLVTGTTW